MFRYDSVKHCQTIYIGNPCNVHLLDLAKEVKKGCADEDLVGLIFNTIGVR